MRLIDRLCAWWLRRRGWTTFNPAEYALRFHPGEIIRGAFRQYIELVRK
jgi:hypothetical protein